MFNNILFIFLLKIYLEFDVFISVSIEFQIFGKLCFGSLEEKFVRGLSINIWPVWRVTIAFALVFEIWKSVNDDGRRLLWNLYMHNAASALYISSTLRIILDLKRGSVWLLYWLLLIVRIARFCNRNNLPRCWEFPHICIP